MTRETPIQTVTVLVSFSVTEQYSYAVENENVEKIVDFSEKMDNSGTVNIPVPDVRQDGLLHETEPLHRRCLCWDGQGSEYLSEHDPGRLNLPRGWQRWTELFTCRSLKIKSLSRRLT